MIKKLAIIGASYLQNPLILKAKEMGIETHVFAWATDDVGERTADFFYPISIIEKDTILDKCKSIGIDGICSIGSDLAMLTVNYVAEHLGLTGNSWNCTLKSTNKHLMRLAFEENGDPSPQSIEVDAEYDLATVDLRYPLIVKPVDRSGSRGIYKVDNFDELVRAVPFSIDQSFGGKAIVEEFVEGKEYSVEYISWNGKHYFIALTEKFTTGAPHFIETGHRIPASVPHECLQKIKRVVEHALDSLGIEDGASHSEVLLEDDGNVVIVEIGGRMGGDLIGSHLVPMATDYDYVKAVLDVAMGYEPDKPSGVANSTAVVEFLMDSTVTDSSNRLGCRVYSLEKGIIVGNCGV